MNYTFGTKAKQQYPPHMLAMAQQQRYDIPDPGMYQSQAELYKRLSWVMSAVSIASETATLQPLSVNRMVGEETEAIPNHDFEKLLLRPNPLQSRFEFLQSTFGYRKLTGNAYWWLNKPGGENAAPAEIWVIPSYKIKPVPDGRLYLGGYAYDPGDGQTIPLETWEVVHFKAFNPTHEFVGLSGVEPVAQVAITDLAKQDWNRRLYGDSNARLPGILAFADPINPQSWEQIKSDVRESAEKRNFMMLRNVGKGGVEYIQAAATLADMEFNAGREFTKEEIYAIFAPGLASILAINATEANAKSGKQTFLEFCIWPMLVSVAEKITNNLLPVYGDNLVAEFEDPRQVDKVLQLAEQEAYSKTHTVDEIRAEYYGDDPIGDERGELLPVEVGKASIPEPEPEPMTSEPIQPIPSQAQTSEEPAIADEMAKWARKAAKALERGRSASVDFKSDIIPAEQAAWIREALKMATTEDGIRRVFESSRSAVDKQTANLAAELKRANDLLEAVTHA